MKEKNKKISKKRSLTLSELACSSLYAGHQEEAKSGELEMIEDTNLLSPRASLMTFYPQLLRETSFSVYI
jgi:hypothetical protein